MTVMEGDQIFELSGEGPWSVSTRGYDPLREPSVESRFSISNGFLGVRGGRAVTRGASWVVPPRTYIGGLFDTPEAENAIPVLVPAASWLQVRISIPGKPLKHHPYLVPSHRMILDMKRGLLLTCWSHNHAGAVTMRLRTLRLVSFAERSLGLQVIRLEIERGEADVTFESAFEGIHLGLNSEQLNHGLCHWRTQYSGKSLAMATASSFEVEGYELPAAESGPLSLSWSWKCRPGQVAHFQRMVAFVRSDSESIDPVPIAREKLAAARHAGWRGLIAAHENAWAKRWRDSDVEIEGDEPDQQAVRFAIYHLNSAVNPDDERISIGARALTGDDYHGHVFWDTEIYLLPFYIFTWPEAARALLMYRYHTLDGARHKAARMGWRGALYAWESADTGEETTPLQVTGPDRRVIPVLCGTHEQHISADVAYAVWNYWQATGDDEFLLDAGVEIILETGRFWASRAAPEDDGRCHIRDVIGPDEYHERIDDNAYTNVMARWNIRQALGVAALLSERWPQVWARLSSRLSLTDDELKQWRAVADAMADGLDPKTGLFEQFEGYFQLEDINLADYAGRSVPMDVVLGRTRTAHSQVVKQADVVALIALLPEEFSSASARANFLYYEPRCGHGSSLSPAMHGLAAARLGETETALTYFRRSAAIDLSDAHVGPGGGVHIAALGGNWMLVVQGFAGLSLTDGGIALDPKLPSEWRGLAFAVQWRGRLIRIEISQDKQRIEAKLEKGGLMTVTIAGERYSLEHGHPLRVNLDVA